MAEKTLEKKDLEKWLNKIVVEVAELSVMKDIHIQIRDCLKETNNNSLLIANFLYKNFLYTFITRLSRLIEDRKKSYADDYSLIILLGNLKKIPEFSQNSGIDKDICLLRENFKIIKNLRDKKIAHYTNSLIEKDLTWNDTDKILELIQNTINKYLKLLTNKTIPNWKIFLDPLLAFGYGNPVYENGDWTFTLTGKGRI